MYEGQRHLASTEARQADHMVYVPQGSLEAFGCERLLQCRGADAEGLITYYVPFVSADYACCEQPLAPGVSVTAASVNSLLDGSAR